jgi:hypothetical protein
MTPARCCRLAVLLVLASPAVFAATIIHVPSDYPTIQAAISAASGGDTVLVSPGTYFERLNFLGKDIIVRSEAGASTTILDGSSAGSVVTFESGEGPAAVLEGFTIQHGQAIVGAGIYILASSPTIKDNRIVSNTSIQGQPGFGAGMLLVDSQATIVGNEIAYNLVYDGDAGGVGTTGFTNSVLFERNVIHHNTALGNGGGLYLRNVDAELVNNTIAYNTSQAWHGGGIDCYVEGTGPKTLHLTNCIVWGNSSGMGGLEIYNEFESVDLVVDYTDVDGGWAGLGNIGLPPLFVNGPGGNLALTSGSPCIDAGDPASPHDPDGSVADMGALSFTQPFQSVGAGLAGSNGIPKLVATGTLLAGPLERQALLPLGPRGWRLAA